VDFWRTLTVLGRRWYVAIPVFLLVVAAAGVIAVRTPHQYESTGTMVISEPSHAESGAGAGKAPANPLLEFADSLTTDAELLVQSLNSPGAAAQVQTLGGSATFTASDGGLQGPFVVVTADALTPGPTQSTVALAFRFVADELLQRQKDLGAPASSFVTLKSVVDPETPVLKTGGKSRLAGATLILGLAATLTVTFLADAYLRRRRVRA
jgi:hypothetical protein